MTLQWKQEKFWKYTFWECLMAFDHICFAMPRCTQTNTHTDTHTHSHSLSSIVYPLICSLYLSLVCLCLFFLPRQYQVLNGNGIKEPTGALSFILNHFIRFSGPGHLWHPWLEWGVDHWMGRGLIWGLSCWEQLLWSWGWQTFPLKNQIAKLFNFVHQWTMLWLFNTAIIGMNAGMDSM